MTNVLTFPRQMPTPRADREDLASYGAVGLVSIDLIRTPTIMPEVVQIVVTGPPAMGFRRILTMPDSERGRGFCDVVGRAVFEALEMAETARTAADPIALNPTGAQP